MNLVGAIAEGSADRALGLVHTFQKEGRNLQHFCREAIRHMRNLLIARVCGADSDLIAATADQRPALAKAAAQFSEEDLTRFFQILLQTDDDLRRKPDPRVHLEMGLLRLINAARLAPHGRIAGGTPQRGACETLRVRRATRGNAASVLPLSVREASAAGAEFFAGAANILHSATANLHAKFCRSSSRRQRARNTRNLLAGRASGSRFGYA